jgi:hypothetical protein
MALPSSVTDLVENHPFEDVLLPILRAGLPDVEFVTLIPEEGMNAWLEGQSKPFVLVRRHPEQGFWRGDGKFTDGGSFILHAYTEDPNGDEDGALLSEACRVVLRNAWLNKVMVSGLGGIAHIRMLEPPRRTSDWATASGPVQYADLPTGMWRYETIYRLVVRRPL